MVEIPHSRSLYWIARRLEWFDELPPLAAELVQHLLDAVANCVRGGGTNDNAKQRLIGSDCLTVCRLTVR